MNAFLPVPVLWGDRVYFLSIIRRPLGSKGGPGDPRRVAKGDIYGPKPHLWVFLLCFENG